MSLKVSPYIERKMCVTTSIRHLRDSFVFVNDRLIFTKEAATSGIQLIASMETRAFKIVLSAVPMRKTTLRLWTESRVKNIPLVTIIFQE